MKKRTAMLGMMMLLSTTTITGSLTPCYAAEQSVSAEQQTVTTQQQGIELEGVTNARQLGGYIGADGRKVKADVLLRTGKLAGATPEAIQKLEDVYHLTEVIDFRTSSEKEAEPDPEIPNAVNVGVSVMEEEGSAATVASASDPMAAMIEYAKSGAVASMYTDMVRSEYAQQGYAQFFQELVKHEDGAILWHCTGGKDRAGLATVLLLSALGVDQETILQDFNLSNEYYTDMADQMAAAAEAQGCTEEEIQSVRDLCGVNRAYMEAALDVIDEEYGSMAEYLKNQLKVTEEDIAVLQEKYLEA